MRQVFKVSAIVLVLFGCSTEAKAACTGSSPTWTSSPDIASVNSCFTKASDGDTIKVSAGSATWTSSPAFSVSKKISLVGAGIDLTTITLSATVKMLCGAGKPHRLSGFTFVGGSTDVAIGVSGTCADFRIDHNKLRDFSDTSDAIDVDEFQQGTGDLTGLIDNNQFIDANNNFRVLNVTGENTDSWPSSPVGTRNTVFFEDNVIDFGNMTNAGSGCVDSNYTGHYVWRNNTTRNCLVTAHGVCNGPGTVSVEIYNNNFTANGTTWPDGTRLIHHQGSGEMYIFGNRFTASSGRSSNVISLTHYRSAPAAVAGCNRFPRCDGSAAIDLNLPGQQGYACFHEPARNATGQLRPIYLADNLWNDNTRIQLGVENPWGATSPSVDDHVKSDREYYDEVSGIQTSPSAPFNGTTGTGWGTLANRPVNCTAGVGYWATDQGEWNSRHAGPDGQLFKCTATNTWSVYYTPYQYPHPLQAGGGGLAAPSNLRIIR